jgi:hypothetical protein
MVVVVVVDEDVDGAVGESDSLHPEQTHVTARHRKTVRSDIITGQR